MAEQAKKESIDETILRLMKEESPETVKQLAELTQHGTGASQEEILDRIVQLEKEGKMRLDSQPTNLEERPVSILKTTNAAWYWITLGLTLVSIVAIFTIPEDLQPYAMIRYVLGTIFILWLPGYTFIKALFPQTSPSESATSLTRAVQSLDSIERIALSIGLSLALVPMIGLLLNYTPWGIRLAPITFVLAALTLTFATVALVRENQVLRSTR